MCQEISKEKRPIISKVALPVAIAALDDMHAIVTVCAGILSEKPALSRAYYTEKPRNGKLFQINLNTSRATLDVLTS